MRRVLMLVLAALWVWPVAAAEGGVKAKGEPDLSAFGGWQPQPVKNPPEQEVRAFLDRLEAAQDPEAWAAVIRFPVLMVTTDAAGVAVAMPMDQESFEKAMQMDPAAEEAMKQFEHGKPELTWITPSIVFVNTAWWAGKGKGKLTWQSGMLLIKAAEGWRVQGMAEGGWAGEMPAGPPQPPGDAGQ